MRIAIGITTYNRPSMLMRLIEDIDKYGKGFDVVIKVIDDGSSETYTRVIEHLRKGKHQFIKQQHRGKKGYWRTINTLYAQMMMVKFDYFYFFPDDFRLAPDYFKRSIDYWNMIDDASLIGLNTMNTGRVNPGWTRFQPEDRIYGGVLFTKNQWLDCHLMCTPKYFDAMHWRVPNAEKWIFGSSGVGALTSQYLHKFGHSMYVCPNLIAHGDHDSVMHPDERRKNPLISII
jgi:glycosyltransferase involved in cell wall biosynthesis